MTGKMWLGRVGILLDLCRCVVSVNGGFELSVDRKIGWVVFDC